MGKLLSEKILDLGKCTSTFTFMRFLVGALPDVQNQFRKQFFHKVLYNFCSKIFLRSKKKMISHCIFKNGLVRCRGIFSHLKAQLWYTSSCDCPEEPQGEDRCCL